MTNKELKVIFNKIEHAKWCYYLAVKDKDEDAYKTAVKEMNEVQSTLFLKTNNFKFEKVK